MNKLAGLLLLQTIGLNLPGAASAHHSGLAFDTSQNQKVGGTVKEFRWTNPHTWISLIVPDGKGGTMEYGFEGAAVSILARWGWTATTLMPGDKAIVTFAPYKDPARHGGEFRVVEDPQGNPVGGTMRPL